MTYCLSDYNILLSLFVVFKVISMVLLLICFFFLLIKQNTAKKITTAAATDPITIPTIAPGDNPPHVSTPVHQLYP